MLVRGILLRPAVRWRTPCTIRAASALSTHTQSTILEENAEKLEEHRSRCQPHAMTPPHQHHKAVIAKVNGSTNATEVNESTESIQESPIKLAGSIPEQEALDTARDGLNKVWEDAKKEQEDLDRTLNRTRTYQAKEKQRMKALSRLLDTYLRNLNVRKQFDVVEAVAYLWEDVFPQFKGNSRHLKVLCDNYAWALNQQKRFHQTIDVFVTKHFARNHPSRPIFLSRKLSDAVFLACGHTGSSKQALELLQAHRQRETPLSNVAYFHLIHTLLRDDDFIDLDLVLSLCTELHERTQEGIPLSLVPLVLQSAAESGALNRAMELYVHPPNARLDTYSIFRFEIALQKLTDRRCFRQVLVIYQKLMRTVPMDVQKRISKDLLNRCSTDLAQPSILFKILDVMQEHGVRTNATSTISLFKALFEHHHFASIDAFEAFVEQYDRVFRMNSFLVSEAAIAAAQVKDSQMVEQVLGFALEREIFIKYAALEQAIACFYKLKTNDSMVFVADMVKFLRRNQHIPLGVAVCEMGMMANAALGRDQEVVLVFEDFASRDGENQRVVYRSRMLEQAERAYIRLNQLEEASAVRQLLNRTKDDVVLPDERR